MATDARYEAWLRHEGVRFQYVPNIPLDSIDKRASLEAQARLGKQLNEEVVLRYAYAMEEGAVFPPVVIYDAGGRNILIGGNHRVPAAEMAGRKTIDAYEVTTDDRYVIDRMTRSMNFALESPIPVTMEEALEQAIFLATTYGKSAAEVARSFNLKQKEVEKALRRTKHATRIEKLGISTKHITGTVIDELGKLNDRPLVAVEQLREATKMPHEKLRELVKEVGAKTSEDEQLKVVADWSHNPDIQNMREQSRSGTVPRPTTVARMRLYRLVGELERLLKSYTTPSSLQLTRTTDVEDFRPRWQKIDEKMEALFSAAKKSLVGPMAATHKAATRRR